MAIMGQFPAHQLPQVHCIKRCLWRGPSFSVMIIPDGFLKWSDEWWHSTVAVPEADQSGRRTRSMCRAVCSGFPRQHNNRLQSGDSRQIQILQSTDLSPTICSYSGWGSGWCRPAVSSALHSQTGLLSPPSLFSSSSPSALAGHDLPTTPTLSPQAF